MKLLAGDDEELGQIIPILLGCNKENIAEGSTIDMTVGHKVKNHMIETSYSHLLEVRCLKLFSSLLLSYIFFRVFALVTIDSWFE